MAISTYPPKVALTVMSYRTEVKTGIIKLVWPPLFRGVEQPDEEHPSVADRIFAQKFAAAHPQPFEELKEVQNQYGLSDKVMDFLEQPLHGRLRGMANPPREPVRSLEDEMEEWYLFRDRHEQPEFISETVSRFEFYLREMDECLAHEQKLTRSYRSWLVRKLTTNIDFLEGGGGPGVSLLDKAQTPPYLRRDEILRFTDLRGYDTRERFDMERHNQDAFLVTYEREATSWRELCIIKFFRCKVLKRL